MRTKNFSNKGDVMNDPTEVLKHYTEQIIESPLLKTILSLIGVGAFHIFGPMVTPMWYLLVVVIVDLITGIAKSVQSKTNDKDYSITQRLVIIWITLCSKSMRNGLWKIIEYLTAIAIANIISVLVGFPQIREFVIIYMVITELRSIHENLIILGFDIPLADGLISRAEDTMNQEKDKHMGGGE